MIPLCVDLDGTLIYDDVTLISCRNYIHKNKFRIFQVLFWWLRGGRAFAKYKLSEKVKLDPSILRYNEKFVEYIKGQKRRPVFLATGCCEKYAYAIATHLGLFDGVFASTKNVNLIAKKKAKLLVNKFGNFGFAYAGNSKSDLYVWKYAAEIIVVNPSNGVIEKLKGRKYKLFE